MKKRIRAIPVGRALLTGNEAIAVAVILSRVHGIAAYPITPQTIIVERLSEYTSGREDIIFKRLDSEHSMLAWAIGMGIVVIDGFGMRVFTSSSSQGVLYAFEQLFRVPKERLAIVMAVANRSLTPPWSLEPDFNDSMSVRDAGWIQFYCATNQEVFDTILLAYRIAEHVMLPIMVCEEGFLLSHTSEMVVVPQQDVVDKFLPPFMPPDGWGIDPDKPRVISQVPTSRGYMHFQKNIEDAMGLAEDYIEESAAEFEYIFGHKKIGGIEVSGNFASSRALITMGTIGKTARLLHDDEKYKDILLVRVHAFRPFPKKALRKALENISDITVVDRSFSLGGASPLAADISKVFGKQRRIVSFIAGIGGVSVTEKTLKKLIDRTPYIQDDKTHWVDEGGDDL